VRIYYRSSRVLITEHVFTSQQLGRRRFRIRDLAGVHIVQYEPDGDEASRVLGLSALGAALLVIPVLSPVSALVAALTCAVFGIGAIVHVRRRGPVRWELAATCGRQQIALFTSEDQTEFEQVCRALQRALERQGENG
jgi:uncharacterized protein DUF6232